MTKRRHTTQYEFPFGGDAGDAHAVDTPSHAVDTPPPTPLAAEAVARGEVLGLCPRLFSRLPAASTLVCEHAEVGRVLFTTSRATYDAHARGMAAFTGTELAAMALAAEHERGSPTTLSEWCTRKAHFGPTWRLTAVVALGPVVGRFEPRGWTIGRVFEWLGLRLDLVHVHEAGEVLLLTKGVSHAATK